MKSLRTKFALGVTILIIFTISITGYLMIRQKSQELKQDIFVNAFNYAELMVEPIMESHSLYYESESFALFNRDIANAFSLNNDISQIQIADYNGVVLYDSVEEEFAQYQGEDKRMVADYETLQRLQDVKASILTDQRIVYVAKDALGNWVYTDRFEAVAEPISSAENVINIIYPYTDNKSRVILSVSYALLESRMWESTKTIFIILTIISILGIALGTTLAGQIIRPIKSLTKGASEIAKGNLKYQVEVKTKDEIKTLASAFNKMARDLEITTKAMIEKEKITKELEIARKIQQDLIPKDIPELKGLDIAASIDPAGEVGGDCYDFLRLDEDNTLIYVGDVTGHGVPASLVVSITNAVFYAMLEFKNSTSDIISTTNKIIHAKTETSMFVTAVLCNWNDKDQSFTYTQAGHEKIFHYKAASKSFNVEPSGGMALGMIPDLAPLLKEHELKLEVGDYVVLYSDGIPEAWKSPTEMLGMEGFQKILEAQDPSKSASELHASIHAAVTEYRGGYEQMDDITLMIIKRV